ncbi:MAG: DUF3617 domain-containing protein [Proteobacteria bacterium]|nr:DUF3617 domain-containing protein [Pseudomonadota bacterium]
MQLRMIPQIALCAVGALAAVQAAELTKPNIKPGLWEVSVSPKMSGEMPIPEDQLAKMTPEQRARIEAAMKNAGAKPHVYKECMTPEKIAKGFEMDRGADAASCKRNVISSTPSELTLHDECNDPKRKSSTDVHFEIKGGTQMNGKVHIVVTQSGKSMTVDSTLTGKWLAASCGSVKDSEPEK